MSAKVNLSSAGACKVDSGARGGEANKELSNSPSLPLSLQTPLHYTVLDTLFTHSTLKPTHYTHLNDYHNYVIRHFVLYLADKAGNTQINTQQLNLLSWKRK